MAIGTPTLTGYRDVTRTPSAPVFGFLNFSKLGLMIFGESFHLWRRIFWLLLAILSWERIGYRFLPMVKTIEDRVVADKR